MKYLYVACLLALLYEVSAEMPWEEITTSETKPSGRTVIPPSFTAERWSCLEDMVVHPGITTWTLDRSSYEWNLITTLGTKPSGVMAIPPSFTTERCSCLEDLMVLPTMMCGRWI